MFGMVNLYLNSCPNNVILQQNQKYKLEMDSSLKLRLLGLNILCQISHSNLLWVTFSNKSLVAEDSTRYSEHDQDQPGQEILGRRVPDGGGAAV